MKKEELQELLKLAYRWGQDNGSNRSDKNFNDFLQTSKAKEVFALQSYGLEIEEEEQLGDNICRVCKGEGWVHNKNGISDDPCLACGGTGVNVFKPKI
jgi:hypothetical protein